jgi:hypothetical protein
LTVISARTAAAAGTDDICEFQLIEVGFFNDIEIYKDQVGKAPLIEDPVWIDNNGDGSPEKDDRVGYVSSDEIKVKATFKIITSSSEPVDVTIQVENAQLGLRGDFYLGNVIGQVDTDIFFIGQFQEGLTQYFSPDEPLEFKWSYSTDGSEYRKIGVSKHTVYVTLQEKSEYLDKVYLTLLHLATSVGGATTKAEAVEKTWSWFANPTGADDLKTWNNRALRYYGTGIDACHNDIEAFLKAPDASSGGCGVFANLLIETLWINGITSRCVTIEPASPENPEGMLVREWEAINTSFPDKPRYKWRFLLHEEEATMIPPFTEDLVYGDLKSIPGLPGQNSVNPLEKAFLDHFIVKVEAPSLPYYDPSYGMTYSGNQETAQKDFEAKAIYGYFVYYPGDDIDNYRVRQHQNRGDVLFEENPGNNPLCGTHSN